LSNVVTGGIISLFVVGIWAYSIRAVRQDVFDDVDEEAKALTQEKKKQVETVEERAKKVEEKLKAIATERVSKVAASLKSVNTPPPPRERQGILPILGRSELGWYDPTKTLVWGAPSVDNFGRIGDRTTKD
jgi:cytochrome c oxidase assembly factor 3, fungi type